ncbi:hypothetical protein [Roseomonas sp. AR75]|uniref:hypothetical protein n=1 Tax=Roseomonas sp. AR75 TaxID=2562311 RepID=UPI0010C07922|nr:hypothetical protein [Roseomonas sp. AR75]
MDRRTSIALLLLVVALPLIPFIGGLTASGMLRDLSLIGLIAVVGGAFVFLIAGRSVPTPATPLPGVRSAAAGVVLTLGSALLLAVLLTALIIWVRHDPSKPWSEEPWRLLLTQYGAVAFFAGAVGFGELIARYRDDPGRLLGLRPAAAYVAINVAAGVIALALVQQFEVVTTQKNKALVEGLIAAFGAIAFFRTSLFTARVGDTDVGIGPSTMLKTFLESCDRMVNRDQATARADAVGAWMKDVDFAKAQATLPAFCLGLVEGLDADEQRALGDQIKKLGDDKAIAEDAKARILGAYLLRQVGADVLRKAVETLGETIRRRDAAPLAEPADPPA